MYRLMLVEDEPIVLEGMLKIIDFKALGFEVVCSCGNGLEAIEAYKIYKPEVVVTDICMEKMDGLEFIETVTSDEFLSAHEALKEIKTKFVIISGHQDFTYFKRALSLKVTDYILKPVTSKEFSGLLSKISMELDAFVEEGSSPLKSAEHIEVEKNMFFNKFMHLKMNKETVLERLKSFDVQMDKPYFQVAIFKIKGLMTASKENGFKHSEGLLNDLHKRVDVLSGRVNHRMAFVDPQGTIVLIVNETQKEMIEKVVRGISDQVRRYYEVKDREGEIGVIDCYLGLVVEELMSVPNSFRSANRLNVCGVLKNQEAYYQSEDILFTRANRKYDYLEPMNEWIRAIIFSHDVCQDILSRMYKDFYEAGYLLTDFRVAATRMLDTLYQELMLISSDLVEEQPVFDHMDEVAIKTRLSGITNKLCAANRRSHVGVEDYVAKKAVEFIESHYKDSNLDLQQICKSLGVSVSYFSAAFKKYTSMTFVKYLNNYRIEKAKYCLEYSDSSISEVSEQVGYVDAHYFGIVFKKYTGLTPKKYRVSVG